MDDFLMPEELDNADDDENDMMKIAEGMETTTIVDAGMKTAAESEEEYLEQMKELVEQYKQIKNETKEIDELARQLAIGVHLQTEMDKCASERRDFPIQIGLELRFLASGSSLLLVKLQNTSDLVLHKWHLAVNMTPLSSAPSNGCDALKSFSKSIAVERLGKDKEFTCEVFCTQRLLVPFLLRPQLLKQFPGSVDSGIFCLELESMYFSLWDLISEAPDSSSLSSQSSIVRAVVYQRTNEEQTLVLPEALVFLLCNEQASEKELLKWIVKSVDESCTNCFECVLRENATKIHPMRVEVRKAETRYEVVVAMKNAILRAELVAQLQIRILVKMRYVYRELESKSGCEEVIDTSSIAKYFNSCISRFIT